MEDDLMEDDLFAKSENASCEPENGLYIKILAFLSQKGINKECDISHLFDKSYLEPQYLEHAMRQYRNKLIEGFLSAIKNEDHINYQNLTKEIRNGTVDWMKPIVFKAQITPKGDRFYKDDLSIKKSLSNYKWNRWLAIGALIVSISSLFYTMYNHSAFEIRMERLEKPQKRLLIQQKKLPGNIPKSNTTP